MYFSVRNHSHSRIGNRQQLQIFSMPNISWVSEIHWRFPQIPFFDNSQCAIVTRVNERFASDFGHLSAIYQNSVNEKSG